VEDAKEEGSSDAEPTVQGPEIKPIGLSGGPSYEAHEGKPTDSWEASSNPKVQEPSWVKGGMSGIARDVRWDRIQHGNSSTDSLSLRLETLDGSGNIHKNIPIRIERMRIKGIVKEGDNIVVMGWMEENGFLTPGRIYNRDLNLDFRLGGGAGVKAAMLFMFILWFPAMFYSIVPAIQTFLNGDIMEGLIVSIPGLAIIIATFALAYYLVS
jgi:hypothetical protein